MRALGITVVWLVALWAFALPALAQDYRLGFLGLADDPRYNADLAYARIALTPQGDTMVAARMAVGDMKVTTDAVGFDVVLDAARVGPDALVSEAVRMAQAGVAMIVLDLPAEAVDALAEGLAETVGPDGPILINATAPDDWLRRRCHARLIHTAASDRMIADALIQHMVKQKWGSVLILQGKSERDRLRAETFAASAARFRINIVGIRSFDLSTNPALREENNIALLTGGTDAYDTVFIADEEGEFSRYVPFRTALPRPVIGATGLVALEWHWALERYGAPQVNSRFEDMSEGRRRMGWQDWSVWMAVKAALTARAKARDPSPQGVEDYMRSNRLRLDGSKGAQMNFRPWDGQMRQPIVLASHNAIIEMAPIEGFLHQSNTLDSLGTDEGEFACN